MINTATRLIVATDGSAINNPSGPAGWAWFVDEHRWACGGFAKASNQVAELFAILAVLRAIPNTVPVTIRTDSLFAVNLLTSWLPSWRQKDGSLRKKDGTIPANLALVEELDGAFRGRDVELVWVKGHSGNMLNEIADKLCGSVSSALHRKVVPPKGPGWVPLPAGYTQPNVNAVVAGTRPKATRPGSSGPTRRTGGASRARPGIFTDRRDDDRRERVRAVPLGRGGGPVLCPSCDLPIHPHTFECGCSR